MDNLAGSRKNRTDFRRIVTNGYNQIDVHVDELGDAFRPQFATVYFQILEHFNRQGMDTAGMHSRGAGFDLISQIVPEQRFTELTAHRVARTDR